MYVTNMKFSLSGASTMVAGVYEANLGTLTISGNSFSGGASMPSRVINNGTTAIQLVSTMPMLYVSSSLTATTPTITITYTNQDGVTGRTASLTLSSANVVGSAFNIMPHLQSGDSGIMAVTNMSTSAGSAGTMILYGTIPICTAPVPSSGMITGNGIIPTPGISVRLAAGDIISFYRFGAIGGSILTTMVSGVADT
jgi:hypothetical protein